MSVLSLTCTTANGSLITKVSEATSKDVDRAVEAAQKTFDTVWGLNTPGKVRAELMNKLALAMEACADELAALDALDNGGFCECDVQWDKCHY